MSSYLGVDLAKKKERGRGEGESISFLRRRLDSAQSKHRVLGTRRSDGDGDLKIPGMQVNGRGL